jgi:hypothetical protein
MGCCCWGGYPPGAPVLMGGRGLAGRPCWALLGAPRPPDCANVYEGGRPSGFCWFMGSDELLEFEA